MPEAPTLQLSEAPRVAVSLSSGSQTSMAGTLLIFGALSWVRLDDGLSLAAMAQAVVRPATLVFAIFAVLTGPSSARAPSPVRTVRVSAAALTMYSLFAIGIALTAADVLGPLKNGADMGLLVVLLWLLIHRPTKAAELCGGVLRGLILVQAVAVLLLLIDPSSWRAIDSPIPLQAQISYPAVNPNGMGSIALIATLFLVFPRTPWTLRSRLVRRMAIALSLAMLLLAQSRTAYSSALLAALLLAIDQLGRLSAKKQYRVALLVFIALGGIVLMPTLLDMYTRGLPLSEFLASKSGRADWWQAAQVVETRMIGGGGLGSTQKLSDLLAALHRHEIGSLHNSWLEAKISLGVVPAYVLATAAAAFVAACVRLRTLRAVGLLGLALAVHVFARAFTSSDLMRYSLEFAVLVPFLGDIAHRTRASFPNTEGGEPAPSEPGQSVSPRLAVASR